MLFLKNHSSHSKILHLLKGPTSKKVTMAWLERERSQLKGWQPTLGKPENFAAFQVWASWLFCNETAVLINSLLVSKNAKNWLKIDINIHRNVSLIYLSNRISVDVIQPLCMLACVCVYVNQNGVRQEIWANSPPLKGYMLDHCLSNNTKFT